MVTLAKLVAEGNVYQALTVVGYVWKPLGRFGVDYQGKSVSDVRVVRDRICIRQGEKESWEKETAAVFDVYPAELAY